MQLLGECQIHWRPEDYYDSDRTTPNKSYCKRGGFIPEVDFNPMEFGLPPNILELTDTSQLLSLIVAKEVKDAKLPEGYDRDKIGITLGVGGGQKIAQSLNARLHPVLKKIIQEQWYQRRRQRNADQKIPRPIHPLGRELIPWFIG